MSAGSRKKREKVTRPKVETCVVCNKVLREHERPNDPRDPGLCAEHQGEYQTR